MYLRVTDKKNNHNLKKRTALTNGSRIPTLIRGATEYKTETIDLRQAQRQWNLPVTV